MTAIALDRQSGATIQVAGLTGQIRGLKHKLADGTAIRPDFVLIDDDYAVVGGKLIDIKGIKQGVQI